MQVIVFFNPTADQIHVFVLAKASPSKQKVRPEEIKVNASIYEKWYFMKTIT